MAAPGFGRVGSTQFFRVGGAIGLSKVGQLRAGYIHDLKHHEGDLFTAGFGISPFNVFSFDVAGLIGHHHTYGAMVSMAFRI